MADVRGRPLDRVLKDPRVPWGLKTRLTLDFNRRLRNLSQAIEKTYSIHPENRYRSDVLTYDQNGHEFHIRKSQVVVEFDPADPNRYKLTLVDGY